MTNPTKDVTSKSNLTIGLDLGDRFSLFVAIDSGGEEVRAGNVLRPVLRSGFRLSANAGSVPRPGLLNLWGMGGRSRLAGYRQRATLDNPRYVPSRRERVARAARS